MIKDGPKRIVGHKIDSVRAMPGAPLQRPGTTAGEGAVIKGGTPLNAAVIKPDQQAASTASAPVGQVPGPR